MVGLTVHNFLSAATGIALALAFTRAFARSGVATVGNFWVDLTRMTLYVLLPLSIIIAICLRRARRAADATGAVDATTLEGAKQTIAMGPIASQEAIKQLGTNGGGFLNVNSAHPFENPNALSNILQIFSMLVISVGARRSPSDRWSANCARATRCSRRWAFCCSARVDRRLCGRDLWQSDSDRAWRRSFRRQSRRQGDALRAGHDRAFRRRDDGPLLRRRQRHARLADAARRPRAVVPDPARRSAAGRRRLGTSTACSSSPF